MIHNLKHTAQSSIRRSLITKFMGPTWGPPDADRTQIGPCSPHESCYLGSWYQYTHICRKRSLSVNNCTIPLAFYTRSALCWALFNSSPPNAAYLPPCIGLAMIQIMVCRLSLSRLNQCWLVNWKLRNKFHSNQNTKLFIHENVLESIVCQTGGHFSKGRWVDWEVSIEFTRTC